MAVFLGKKVTICLNFPNLTTLRLDFIFYTFMDCNQQVIYTESHLVYIFQYRVK